MFGKGKKSMSGNDKFIMAKGRAVGNIKPPAGSANLKKAGSAKGMKAPVKAPTSGKPPQLFVTKASSRPSKGTAGPVKL